MGAKETVDWKMSADTAEVLRAWQQMAQGQEKVIQKMDQMGRRGRASADEASSGMDKLEKGLMRVGMQYLGIHKAMEIATRAARALYDAQRKVTEEAEKAQFGRDVTFSNFRIQAGLTAPGAGDRAKQVLNASAARAGVSLEQADQAGTALLSAGVQTQDVLGGVLDKFLDTAKAMNAAGRGADPTDTAKAATMLMSASGVDKDAAGFERFGRTMTGLFETNVELADLQTFAGKAGAIRQMTGQSMEEMAAAFAVLRETMPAAEAATGFKTFTQRLGPGKTRLQKRAISSLGLEEDQIDFVGESFEEVVKTLKDALARTDERTGKEAFKRIFGSEGVPAAAAFLADDDLPRYTQLTQGKKFEESAAFARGTLGSRQTSAEARQAAVQGEQGAATVTMLANQRQAEMLERGDNPAGVAIARGIADFARTLVEFFDGPMMRGTNFDRIILEDPTTGAQRPARRAVQNLGGN